MKNLSKTLIVLFLTAFTFSSCSDEEDGPTTSGNLVGKWEFFQEGEKIGSNENLVSYAHQAGCTKDNVEFKADGTVVNKLYEIECELFEDEATYTKSGNSLTIVDNSGTTELSIQELTSTTLKVYSTYNEDGETITDVTVLKRVN